MGVAGVALATIISETISAGLIILSLMQSDGILRLHLKEMKFHKDKVAGMLKIWFACRSTRYDFQYFKCIDTIIC